MQLPFADFNFANLFFVVILLCAFLATPAVSKLCQKCHRSLVCVQNEEFEDSLKQDKKKEKQKIAILSSGDEDFAKLPVHPLRQEWLNRLSGRTSFIIIVNLYFGLLLST